MAKKYILFSWSCFPLCPLLCVYAFIDTYEHLYSSHPWGHIDPNQVSPHMNNQTQLPSAFPNQYLFRQQGSRATIHNKWKATIYTSDLFVMTMPI